MMTIRAFFCLACCGLVPGLWAADDSLSDLRARLAQHLAQSRFDAAQWGVQVVDADSGDVWFEHQAGKLIKPASNVKLFTGALALDVFGPDHRIATSIYAAQKPSPTGELAGDLIVFGRGDPSLAARFHEGNHEGLLDALADAVVRAGVRRVTGDLVGDERYFRGAPYGMNWSWDDLQYYYGAEVSPLTVQDNVVDLVVKPGVRAGVPCDITTKPAITILDIINRTQTVDPGGPRSIDVRRPLGANTVYVSGRIPVDGRDYVTATTVHRPARWFLTLLRESLKRRGVEVVGDNKAVNWLEHYPVDYTRLVDLGHVHSQPMSELVERMMKPSQNLYAQLLLLQAGAVAEGSAEDGEAVTTEDLGLDALRRFLAEAGVPRREAHLEEGSGLSRGTLVTPAAVVTLLRYMWTHPHREAFLDALPVSGVDGTLAGRLRSKPVLKKVRAKTGTLRHISALSGYLQLATGRTLAFAVMLNQFTGGRTAAREAVDRVILLLAESAWPAEPAGKAVIESNGKAEADAGSKPASTLEKESDENPEVESPPSSPADRVPAPRGEGVGP